MKKTYPIRISEETYYDLIELKKFTGIPYGTLVRVAIPLLCKKYKYKRVVKVEENGGCEPFIGD